MARITVEDCLENVNNRFELVMVATKRARALSMGMVDATVDWENDKPTVVALREIAEGHITQDYLAQADRPATLEDEEDEGDSGDSSSEVVVDVNIKL